MDSQKDATKNEVKRKEKEKIAMMVGRIKTEAWGLEEAEE